MLSAFKLSSGTNQDYANCTYSNLEATEKLRHDRSHCSRTVYVTILASEMWSMLATSTAMATFTGGPTRGICENGNTGCPLHLLKHTPSLFALNPSVPPILTPSSICFLPTLHPPTSQTLLQYIEIKQPQLKHAKWHIHKCTGLSQTRLQWVIVTHTPTVVFSLNSLPYYWHEVCRCDRMLEGKNCRGAHWCRTERLFEMNIKES